MNDWHEVFRAYDIRGIAGQQIDAAFVRRLGGALAAWCRARGLDRALVGRDCRTSSPEFEQALTEGLTGAGMDVILLGHVCTPLFYHAVHHLGVRAGVMITASHNPPEYNGFKLWGGDTALSPEQIAEVRDLFGAGAFPEGRGMVSTHDPLPAYLEEVAALERVDPRAAPRVVVDGGNGSAGEIAAQLLERAGISVDRLHCVPDPAFPNHHPDPVVEANAEQLKARVLETGADLGIGLDGDGDRIGAVDETGQLWPGDRLLALFARDILARRPGARIIADVKCSHLLFQDIEARGGEAVMGRTGHSIMKRALREQGAALAGEMSGHMFFNDGFFGWDDGGYAGLRLAALLSRSGRPLSRLLDGWPETHATPEIRIPCPEGVKFAVVERLRDVLAGSREIIDVDGVRVVYPDGWGLVRASNTQAELTLRFEAGTLARLEEIESELRGAVDRAARELL